MSVKITQLKGAYKVKAEAGGFEIVSGRDDLDSEYTGPSPGDLLEASLGLCQGLELAAYLNRRYGVDGGGLHDCCEGAGRRRFNGVHRRRRPPS